MGPYLGLSGYSFMMAAWACLKGVLTSFILAPERPSDRRFLRGSLHFPEGPETPGFGRFLAEGLHLGLQLGVTFPTERGYKTRSRHIGVKGRKRAILRGIDIGK